MPKAKPRFRPYNPDQNAMVVINYQDQLQPGTFEHAVHYPMCQRSCRLMISEDNHAPLLTGT